MSVNRRSHLKMTSTSIRIGSQPIVITSNLKKDAEKTFSHPTKEMIISPIEFSDTDREKKDDRKSPIKKIVTYPKPKYKVKTKVRSKDNIKHRPYEGNEKMEETRVGLKNKESLHVVTKTNSMPINISGQREVTPKKTVKSEKNNITTRRIALVSPPTSPRIDFSHVKSKIGSLDNIKHKPSGGTKKVFDENAEKMREKIALKVTSKVGSLDNIKHKPGGGDKKIYDDKLEFIKSKEIKPKVESLDNIKHKPGGGSVRIYDDKFKFIKSKEVASKVRSLDNINHKPGGGDLKIFDDKFEFIKSKGITSKVGSLENIKHKPGGGDLLIYNENLTFKTTASPRINDGKKKKTGSSTPSPSSPRSELSSDLSSENASSLSTPSTISQM